MKKKLITHIIYLISIGVLVLLDQLSKLWVISDLDGGNEVVIWDGVLKFVSHRNTGAVWGIMSDATILLIIATFVILAIVIWAYFVLPMDVSKFNILRTICAVITAGAIGNLIDRIRLGCVVDFIYFELIDFPVFNVADCYITVSTFLTVILFIFYYKDEDFDFLHKKDKTKHE